MRHRTATTVLVYVNVALWAALAGVLLALKVVNHDNPTPAPRMYVAPTVPPNPDVVVTYVDAPTLDCYASDTALGCWDGGHNVRIVSGLTPTLHAWILAHETAHVYGMTECDADTYAFEVTGNEVIYRQTSVYAEGCGHSL